MTIAFRHTIRAHNIAGGADLVMADCPLPEGCSQLQVWGELHVVSTEADPLEWDVATIYGTEGRVVDVPDPDTNLDLQSLWDQRVPKDDEITGAAAFDLDPNTINAGPFLEAGEILVDGLLGLSDLQPNNLWWTHRKMLSFANNRVGIIAGTPDTSIIADVLKVHSTKRIMAQDMCWSLFAVAEPSFGDVDAAISTFGSEAAWMQIKYMDVILEQAWMEILGLTEAGAETPWEDAALAIQAFVEPEPVFVLAANTANFDDVALHAWMQATFQVEVPGRREIGVISGGRGSV